jgi:hypothetical protein
LSFNPLSLQHALSPPPPNRAIAGGEHQSALLLLTADDAAAAAAAGVTLPALPCAILPFGPVTHGGPGEHAAAAVTRLRQLGCRDVEVTVFAPLPPRPGEWTRQLLR